MPKPIKIVVEVANGEIIGVRADRSDVELIHVDYDTKGPHSFEDQDCSISRHTAEEDPEGVQTIIDAADADEEEVG